MVCCKATGLTVVKHNSVWGLGKGVADLTEVAERLTPRLLCTLLDMPLVFFQRTRLAIIVSANAIPILQNFCVLNESNVLLLVLYTLYHTVHELGAERAWPNIVIRALVRL